MGRGSFITMEQELIKKCEAEAQKWLASSVYDADTKAEIQAMLDNEDKSALGDALWRAGGAFDLTG